MLCDTVILSGNISCSSEDLEAKFCTRKNFNDDVVDENNDSAGDGDDNGDDGDDNGEDGCV